MRLGNFDVRYVSHVCFIFTSPEGRRILTDPFFGREFHWQGHIEKYLSPPAFPPEAIRACDAIFVSHIHGDHYDPAAIQTIVSQTGARVLAPPDVLEDLQNRGLSAERLEAAEEGRVIRFGDVSLTTFGGYDNSRDHKGRVNKYSLMLESAGTRLFYSGDCHEIPPGAAGSEVEAIFFWPHPDDAKLKAFCARIHFKTWVLMHGDKFDPGDFFCNFEMKQQKQRVGKLLPGAKIVIPRRITRP